MKRSRFIRHLGRYSILAALGTGTGYLLYNRWSGTPESCSTNPFCGMCGAKTSCSAFTSLKKPEHGKEQQ